MLNRNCANCDIRMILKHTNQWGILKQSEYTLNSILIFAFENTNNIVSQCGCTEN